MLSCEWILGLYPASPEDLAEGFAQSVPPVLQAYLFQGTSKN